MGVASASSKIRGIFWYPDESIPNAQVGMHCQKPD